MAPTTPPFINPSLRTNGGDDGAAGALASATSAEKKQGSRAPRGPRVSNNYGSFPARRNPTRGAKIDGGVAEAEAAGGSPRKTPRGPSTRKKPRGEETFLLRLDQAKATAEHGRTEPVELDGDPDDRADGGRPKKGLPKTTKAPPVTQEDDGVDDLDSNEEEVDSEDDEGLEDGVAARDEAKRESIPARPRGAKCDGGADNRTNSGRPKEDDDEELDAARDNAMCESILARPRGTKRDGGENDRTDGGGRPKNSLAKTTGNLDYDDEELDNGDIEDLEDDNEELDDGDIKDDEGLEDKGKTAPVMLAGTPPQVLTALFGSTEVFGSTTGGKTQGKSGQGGSAADFVPGTAAGGNFKGGTGQGGSAADLFPRGKAHGVSTRGRQINKEAGAHDVRGPGVESDEDSAPLKWVVEADHKAMRALADNRSFRGTSASRMAADTRAAEAAPGWTGVGADYAAWLRDLWENPTNPDSVISDRATERRT